MTRDPQVELILQQARALPAVDYASLDPSAARRAYAEGRAVQQPLRPDVAASWDTEIATPRGAVRLRIIRPMGATAARELPALVYFHGGGWVLGNIDTHDTLCRIIANKSGVCVISVDYGLSPEHKFPTAIDDCIAASRWVAVEAAALRIDPERIAVGGDSAGANLAAVVAIMARDAGAPKLRFQLLIYPITDMRARSGSYREFAEGFILSSRIMDWFAEQYVREVADLDDWRISPLRARSLAGLPSALVVTAGLDPLRDQGKAYAEALSAAGGAASYRCFEGMIHGFCNMGGVLDAAHRAHETISSSLNAALA
jgi:acetyl esterase